jgi:hypothetical protein
VPELPPDGDDGDGPATATISSTERSGQIDDQADHLQVGRRSADSKT